MKLQWYSCGTVYVYKEYCCATCINKIVDMSLLLLSCFLSLICCESHSKYRYNSYENFLLDGYCWSHRKLCTGGIIPWKTNTCWGFSSLTMYTYCSFGKFVIKCSNALNSQRLYKHRKKIKNSIVNYTLNYICSISCTVLQMKKL